MHLHHIRVYLKKVERRFRKSVIFTKNALSTFMKRSTVNIPVLLSLLLAILVAGCAEQAEQVARTMKSVPNAFGKMNELTIITDQDMWDGNIGDTIDYYYASAYPILPQPEPILDLKHFTPGELAADRLRKELRMYMVVANLADADSPTTKLLRKHLPAEKINQALQTDKVTNIAVKDKWARGQLIIYQFGRNQQDLVDRLRRNFPAVLKRIRQHDNRKIEATVYLDSRDQKLEQSVRDHLDIDMRIPGEYYAAINEPNLMWLRKETPNLSSNLLLYKEPYTSREQLTREHLKALRDSLGREHIESQVEGSYMRINDVDLPMFVDATQIDNKYALQARGIWEIENDYMGGSFVSYLIHDPKDNELIFIDGFVHAPGEDKRNFMMYLEHIIGTVRVL